MPDTAMLPQKRSVFSCLIDIGLGHVMCSGQLNVSVCDLHPLLSGTLHSTVLFHSLFCVPVPSAMRTDIAEGAAPYGGPRREATWSKLEPDQSLK